MGKLFNWFWMLNKRLYKKPTFLALVAMIPLCVLVLALAAGQGSGFVRVALALEDPGDPLASAIAEDFLKENSLVFFLECEDPQAAVKAVETGQADAAWIFPRDMQEKVNAFAGDSLRKNAIMTVVEREQTVFTRLSREKLTAALFQHCATARYISFARRSVPGLETVSDESFMACFDAISLNRELFAFDNVEGGEQQASYLLAPVRGLLAVLLCLGGCAGVLYHMQDEEKGLFCLVRENRRVLVSFGCVGIVVANLAAAVLAALLITGLAGGVFREIAGVALYALSCALFGLLLKEILRSKRLLAVGLPLLVLALCAFCPVFFDFKKLSAVAHIFPPTYYIHLSHDSNYLLYLLLYAAALAVLWLLARLAGKAIKN